MTFKDYAKAVWANKATLASYAAIPTGIALFYQAITSDNTTIMAMNTLLASSELVISMMGLIFTMGGQQTQEQYLRAKENIDKFGKLSSNYTENLTWYCDIQGAKLAVKEAGLEDTVKFNEPIYLP
jgi:hypothetical protein